MNDVLAHTFLKELDHTIKLLLDSVADVQVLEKNFDKLYTLLGWIAQGNPEWQSDISRSAVKKIIKIIEVDSVKTLAA